MYRNGKAAAEAVAPAALAALRVVHGVVGSMAAEGLPDLSRGGERHRPADAGDGRAKVRGEQGSGMAQQPRGDFRRAPGQRPVLHREYVGRVPAEPVLLEGVGNGLLVDY
jgi:hypothetical protein